MSLSCGKNSNTFNMAPKRKKHQPMEMSSKKHVNKEFNSKSRMIRDPRFDDLSGEYNNHIFKATYGFLDDVADREIERLNVNMNKEKDVFKKQQIKQLIKKMKYKQSLSNSTKKKSEKLNVACENEATTNKKKDLFLNKGEKKTLDLAEKYRQLKKSGKIDKFMEKKRKKNASKDVLKMPYMKR